MRTRYPSTRLLWCRLALLVFCLAAIVLTAARVEAQNASDLAREMIGQWELSTAGRDRTCVVTLKNDPASSGKKLDLEKNCATTLPFTKDIAAWTIRGLDIVRLQDGKGEAVIDLTEVESGIFEGLRQGEGVFILQNLAAVRDLAKSTDQMIGDWAVVRGNGRTVCTMTLTNNDAGNDNFQVFLKPRCDPTVANFAPTAWRIERGELLLMSAKREIWRFEADDNAQWRRVPDTADPFLLVRQ